MHADVHDWLKPQGEFHLPTLSPYTTPVCDLDFLLPSPDLARIM